MRGDVVDAIEKKLGGNNYEFSHSAFCIRLLNDRVDSEKFEIKKVNGWITLESIAVTRRNFESAKWDQASNLDSQALT